MSQASIIAQIVTNLGNDASTTSYRVYDYWHDKVNVEDERTGVIEIEPDPNSETETRVDNCGLTHIVHKFRARLSKVTPGDPGDTRDAAETMGTNFKNANEKTEGNLGHADVRRNSLRWTKTKLPRVGQVDDESKLHRGVVEIEFQCEEYQLAGSRS